MIDTQSKLKCMQIGQRIERLEQFGTIKYIGEIDGHKGQWLGIDWDDPIRGKHNGTVNGKQYFTTSYDTSGSFVRPEKVVTGISIIESITSRYGHKDDEATLKLQQQQIAHLEHSWNTPFLKLIGFDDVTNKQSNYQELKVLNARWQNVCNLGEAQQLSHLCPNIVDLDISKNLLFSWEEVFRLAMELEHLQVLNVSENRLTIPEDISQFKIPQLKTLICGTMNLTWKEIEMLSLICPNLQHIYAPNNLISTINCHVSSFFNLELLDIEGNLMSDWNEIMKLKSLPQLSNLNINSLKISHIQIDDSQNFKNLEKLFIKHNYINNWKSISQLNKLQNLTSLGIIDNPIYTTDTQAMINQIIIAMIGKLKLLNGTDVRAERKGAEIDYIKKFGLEWLSLKENEEKRKEFLDVHSRYLELIQLFGEVEESELKVQAKTIKESLIELNLVSEDKVLKKKVPPTLQIQKLVTLCQRLFRLANAPTLIYISQEQPTVEYDLDATREIGLYSIQNGDKIIVKC